MIVLETERLQLRTYTEEQDIDALHAILSDERTMAFWPAPFTREQTANWIRRSVQACEELGFGRWAIMRKTDGAMIGDAGFLLGEVDGVRENDLGYIIHADYWHSGYGREAAEACLRHGFQHFGMRRICANMPYDHQASEAVAIKLGMTLEKEFYNSRNRNILTKLYSISF